jgi:hypothetical protein
MKEPRRSTEAQEWAQSRRRRFRGDILRAGDEEFDDGYGAYSDSATRWRFNSGV